MDKRFCKRSLAILMTLAMCFSLIPVSAFATSESEQVATIRVEQIEKTDLAPTKVEFDSDDTARDLLEKVVGKENIGGDNLITRINGYPTEVGIYWMFRVNGETPMLNKEIGANVKDYKVQKGDYLEFYSVYASDTKQSKYAKFEKNNYEAEVNVPVTVKLLKASNSNTELSAHTDFDIVNGATILVSEKGGDNPTNKTSWRTEPVTGEAKLVFDEVGTYTISARETSVIKGYNQISRPYATIEVKEGGDFDKYKDDVEYDKNNLGIPELDNNNLSSEKITLNSEGEKATLISWKSSNNDVLNVSTGKVKRPAFGEEAVAVTLSATITKGSYSEDKEFLINVQPYNEEDSNRILLEVINSLSFYKISPEYGKDKNICKLLKSDIDKKTEQNIEVKLVNEDKEYFDSEGNILKWNENIQEHNFTSKVSNQEFEFSLNGVKQTKLIKVMLPYDEELVIASMEETDGKFLTEESIKGENTNLQSVSKELFLPKKIGEKKCEIEWTCDSDLIKVVGESYADKKGIVTIPAEDTDVVLTATFKWLWESNKPITYNKDFHIKLKAVSDEEKAETEKELNEAINKYFSLDKIKYVMIEGKEYSFKNDYNTNGVITNFVVPYAKTKLNQENITFDWSTNNKEAFDFKVEYNKSTQKYIKSHVAEVIRPNVGESVISSDLVITLRKNGVEKAVTYTVKVAPITEVEVDKEIALLEKIKNNYWDIIKNKNTVKDVIDTDLEDFNEIYEDSEGKLVLIRTLINVKGIGFAIDENGETGEKVNHHFKFSDPEAMDAFTFKILKKPEKDTKITLNTVLSSRLLGKYAEIYPLNDKLQKLYKNSFDYEMTLKGNGEGGNSGEEPQSNVSYKITKSPIKTEYKVGEKFQPSGLAITKTESAEGKEDIVTTIDYLEHKSDFKFKPALEEALTSDIAEVSVIYDGMTLKQEIIVEETETAQARLEKYLEEKYTEKTAITKSFEPIDFRNITQERLNIKKESSYGSEYKSTWTSSDETVIPNPGMYNSYVDVIRNAEKDKNVTLTVTLTNTKNPSISASKEFELVVKKTGGSNNPAKIEEIKKYIQENYLSTDYSGDYKLFTGYEDKEKLDNITSDFVLKTEEDYSDYKASWTEESDYIDMKFVEGEEEWDDFNYEYVKQPDTYKCTVIRPNDNDETVTLKLTLTEKEGANPASYIEDVVITIKAKEKITEEVLAKVKAQLEVVKNALPDKVKGYNDSLDHVTKVLSTDKGATVSEDGSIDWNRYNGNNTDIKIDWGKSSDTEYLKYSYNSYSVKKRPASGKVAKIITIPVTITSNKYEQVEPLKFDLEIKIPPYNTALKTLTISGKSIAIEKDKTEYEVVVTKDAKSIKVAVETENPDCTVKIDGREEESSTVYLKNKEKFQISVRDGGKWSNNEEKEYTILIKTKDSGDDGAAKIEEIKKYIQENYLLTDYSGDYKLFTGYGDKEKLDNITSDFVLKTEEDYSDYKASWTEESDYIDMKYVEGYEDDWGDKEADTYVCTVTRPADNDETVTLKLTLTEKEGANPVSYTEDVVITIKAKEKITEEVLAKIKSQLEVVKNAIPDKSKGYNDSLDYVTKALRTYKGATVKEDGSIDWNQYNGNNTDVKIEWGKSSDIKYYDGAVKKRPASGEVAKIITIPLTITSNKYEQVEPLKFDLEIKIPPYNTALRTLTISGKSIAIEKDKTEYEVVVEKDAKSIKVAVETENPYCTVKIDGREEKSSTVYLKNKEKFQISVRDGGKWSNNEEKLYTILIKLKTSQTIEPDNTNYPETFEGIPEDFEADIWLPYEHKNLQVGDSAEIYPRRVPQLIDNPIDNNIVRPEFTYEIIGGDSVELENTKSSKTMKVNAVKEGKTVIKITYNKVSKNSATSVVNSAYAIYTVGEKGTVNISTDIPYSKYDTVYFAERNTVPMTFNVNAEGAKQVAVRCNGKELEGTENSYTANLENRSNVIEVIALDENGQKSSYYKVVDARKIEVNIDNKTAPGMELAKGDIAEISFKGIAQPVYKLATFYNPTRKGFVENKGQEKKGTFVSYNLGDKNYKGYCNQYDLAENNTITVNFDEAGEYKFTSGKIFSEWWGVELGKDSTVQGEIDTDTVTIKPVHEGWFSVMPDFTVNVKSENDKIAVTGINLNKTNAEMKINEQLKLEAKVFPENATNKKVVWSVEGENGEYVYINKNGLVKAFDSTKNGYVNVIVETVDGNFKASCKIKVLDELVKPEIVTEKIKSEVREENGNKKLVAIIENEKLNKIIDKLNAEESKNKTNFEIKFLSEGQKEDEIATEGKILDHEVIINKSVFEKISNIFVKEKPSDKTVEKVKTVNISTQISDIILDEETVKQISQKAKADNKALDIKVEFKELNFDNLKKENLITEKEKLLKERIADRPILDYKVEVGNEKVSNFDGNVEIAIAYELKNDEKPEDIGGYYISENGELQFISGSKYSTERKKVIIPTNHFSIYAVGKVPTSDKEDENDKKTETDEVTISIDAKSVGKGYILRETAVKLQQGDTVWSVTERILKQNNIKYKVSNDNKYKEIYVASINGIGEFSYGSGSGWMYNVNDKYPGKGADSLKVSAGDSIQWRYTKSLGKDIGGHIRRTDENLDTLTNQSGIQVSKDIELKVSNSGTAKAEVNSEEVKKIIDSLLKSADKLKNKDKVVEFELRKDKKARAIEFTINKIGFLNLKTNADKLQINTQFADVVVDKTTIKQIADKLNGDVVFKVEKVDKVTNKEFSTNTNDAIKKTIGERPVINFEITAGNKVVSEFNGHLILNINYEAAKDENINNIVLYYIDKNGKLKVVKESYYDRINSKIIFLTNHFSNYAIGYNNVSFEDIDKHWAKDNIEFLASRAVISGITDKSFKPNNKITRAEFVTILMRMSDETVEAKAIQNAVEKFSDVNNKAWYKNSVAWALKTGITKGVATNSFAPQNYITRQDMAVMIKKYATYKNINLKDNNKIIEFTDKNNISKYAYNDIRDMQVAGLMNGSNLGGSIYINPKKNATRAESAKIICALLKQEL